MEIPLHCAKYIVNPEETVTIIITLIINLGRYSQEVHRLLEAWQRFRGHLMKYSPFEDHEDQGDEVTEQS